MKPHPEKVNSYVADDAINYPTVKDLHDVYGQYVRLMGLNPRCDAKDLVEWIRINRPDTFEFEKPFRKLKDVII